MSRILRQCQHEAENRQREEGITRIIFLLTENTQKNISYHISDQWVTDSPH